MARRTLVVVMALGLVAAFALPAQASWTVGPAATVAPSGCRPARTAGDAAAGPDGVVRGFASFQGGTCPGAAGLRWFEGPGGHWRQRVAPYQGRVLAAADDGASTWVLYAAADGTRLAAATRAGAFGPSTKLSATAALAGDLVAAGGRWWAVWTERTSASGLVSLFQARTLGAAVARQRVTVSATVDGHPSLARAASGTAVLVFDRTNPATRRSDLIIGRNPGSAWQWRSLTTDGASRSPSLAMAGQTTHVAWQRGTRIVHTDNGTGTFRTHTFATPGAGPSLAVSASRVHLAWTMARTGKPPHVFLAERSGSNWVGSDVTPAAGTPETALAVASSAGTATVLGAETARLWAKTQARPGTASFRRLGAWVDYLDYSLDPAAAVRDMAANGVRTLYLETARYNSTSDILFPAKVGEWIERAHAAGIKVVGWYFPAYSEYLDLDVRRTLAVARFRSPTGQRFDALAVDIEYQAASSGPAEFNAGVTTHLARVRANLGGSYPIGAIVPAPLGMALNPAAWSGFPWAAVGRYADVVQPMGYWSYRRDCPANPRHCPYQYTTGNVAAAARSTGLPVHVIGGIGDAVSTTGVSDFVRGARDARAHGGSLYDYRTTAPSFWPALQQLNQL
ncbi:MAG TPA: hypothetical protein VG276_10655 [Actinomycetes bacterium]|jgi:hypothetical protein|nr:hypothetical protein [Actinomycetes bacterium]